MTSWTREHMPLHPSELNFFENLEHILTNLIPSRDPSRFHEMKCHFRINHESNVYTRLSRNQKDLHAFVENSTSNDGAFGPLRYSALTLFFGIAYHIKTDLTEKDDPLLVIPAISWKNNISPALNWICTDFQSTLERTHPGWHQFIECNARDYRTNSPEVFRGTCYTTLLATSTVLRGAGLAYPAGIQHLSATARRNV